MERNYIVINKHENMTFIEWLLNNFTCFRFLKVEWWTQIWRWMASNKMKGTVTDFKSDYEIYENVIFQKNELEFMKSDIYYYLIIHCKLYKIYINMI